MSIIAERTIAPPMPEEPIGEGVLDAILQAEREDPDEIVYQHPMATFSTTRAEREKAAQAWRDEGQVAYPDNAEESLRRTEAMLRLRLKMGPREYGTAVHDLVRLHSDHLPKPQLNYQPPEPVLPRYDQPTGAYSPAAIEQERLRQLEIPTGAQEPVQEPEKPAEPKRFSRLRAPLRHIVRTPLQRTKHAA